MAREEAINPPRVVVLRGHEARVYQWRRVLDQIYLPAALILAVAFGAANLPPLLAKPVEPGAVNAWVCQGVTCLAPVDRLEKLLDVLKADKLG